MPTVSLTEAHALARETAQQAPAHALAREWQQKALDSFLRVEITLDLLQNPTPFLKKPASFPERK